MSRLVAPLLAVPLLALVPAPAAHAAGTCQGQPATVESSTPGATLTGTEGPDVILATNTATITALGGDDVICAAGGRLDAGAGSDSVVVTPTGNTNGQSAALGTGVNHYTSSGAMIDLVDSGTATEPNLDVIESGDNSDQVTVHLPVGSHPQVRAGSSAPTARLVVRGLPGDTATWHLQLPSTLTRDGAATGTFANFSAVALYLAPSAAATVRGTPGYDVVDVEAGRVDLDLGAGLDLVGLGSSSRRLPTAGRIALGAGRQDRLYLRSVRKVDLDLRRGHLGPVAVSGVESSLVVAPRVRYTGSRRADVATAYGCRVTMRGGRGGDVLGALFDDRPDLDCTPRFALYGQGGDDGLYGGPRADVLVGGAGRDKANGAKGRDLCSAEKELECER